MQLSRRTRRGRDLFRQSAVGAAGRACETYGVSGDSGGCNRVDRELNIEGQMVEILRPDLARVSVFSVQAAKRS